MSIYYGTRPDIGFLEYGGPVPIPIPTPNPIMVRLTINGTMTVLPQTHLQASVQPVNFSRTFDFTLDLKGVN